MSLTGNMFNEHGQLLISQIYSWLNRSHFYQFHGINYNSLWQNLGPYEIKCSRNTYIWDQINFFFMAKPVVRFYMSGLEGSRVIMSCDYPKASYQFRIYYFSSFSKKKTSPFHCLGLFIYILKSFFACWTWEGEYKWIQNAELIFYDVLVAPD